MKKSELNAIVLGREIEITPRFSILWKEIRALQPSEIEKVLIDEEVDLVALWTFLNTEGGRFTGKGSLVGFVKKSIPEVGHQLKKKKKDIKKILDVIDLV